MSGEKKFVIVLLGDTASTETKDEDENHAIKISVPSKQGLSTCLELVDKPLSSIAIHVPSPVTSYYDPLALASLVSSLTQDGTGTVSVHIIGGDNSGEDLKVVNNSFLLSSLHAESERKGQNERVLIARLKTNTSSITAPVRNPQKVTLNLDDDDDDDDLIDEDNLLDPEATGGILSPPPDVDLQKRAAALDDCGGRKACDNCTCGRAEREANDSKTEITTPPTSSCGNCAKGDAFRCAGCPYLGKPAFKPGEEHLVLDLTDDI